MVRADLRSAIERGDRLEREAGVPPDVAARAETELAAARQHAASLEVKLTRAKESERQMRSLLEELGYPPLLNGRTRSTAVRQGWSALRNPGRT